MTAIPAALFPAIPAMFPAIPAALFPAIPKTDPQLRFNVRALRPISPNITQEGAPEALRCGSVSGINERCCCAT